MRRLQGKSDLNNSSFPITSSPAAPNTGTAVPNRTTSGQSKSIRAPILHQSFANLALNQTCSAGIPQSRKEMQRLQHLRQKSLRIVANYVKETHAESPRRAQLPTQDDFTKVRVYSPNAVEARFDAIKRLIPILETRYAADAHTPISKVQRGLDAVGTQLSDARAAYVPIVASTALALSMDIYQSPFEPETIEPQSLTKMKRFFEEAVAELNATEQTLAFPSDTDITLQQVTNDAIATFRNTQTTVDNLRHHFDETARAAETIAATRRQIANIHIEGVHDPETRQNLQNVKANLRSLEKSQLEVIRAKAKEKATTTTVHSDAMEQWRFANKEAYKAMPSIPSPLLRILDTM
jgi:hypothetical protein